MYHSCNMLRVMVTWPYSNYICQLYLFAIFFTIFLVTVLGLSWFQRHILLFMSQLIGFVWTVCCQACYCEISGPDCPSITPSIVWQPSNIIWCIDQFVDGSHDRLNNTKNAAPAWSHRANVNPCLPRTIMNVLLIHAYDNHSFNSLYQVTMFKCAFDIGGYKLQSLKGFLASASWAQSCYFSC